ncbi:MAG TPA: condensation domain-containing protein, partial [Longimicrobium sp.]|nr:condensation domain-containing protein [Longimicrobium sp.]
MDPASPAYNVPIALRIEGRLSPPALARALADLVARHEVLRTTFPLAGEHPIQRIAEPSAFPLPELDLRPLAPAEREAALGAFAREELSRPFDLGAGPLVRGHLVRLDADTHVLLLAFHHAIFDGASLEVLARELATLYEGSATEDGARPPALPLQYADYALWQRRWLQGEVLERGLAFWSRTLAGAPRSLDLPLDRPRPAAPTGRGAFEPVRIAAPTLQALDALARSQGATRFMALLAALGALLHRCTGSEDLLVGAPVAGRSRDGLEGLIGFFVNTLALRVRLHGEPGFRQLLGRVREHTLAAFAHDDVPFDKVVERVRPERRTTHSPLFQVMLALQRPPAEAVARAGPRFRASEVDIGIAPFDLTWNLWERDGGLEGALLYSTELFEAATITRLVQDLGTLLEEVLAEPDRPLSRLARPSRWEQPEGATTAEVEEALLAQPSVADCAVRLRRPPASRALRVAYVSPPDARLTALPPHLAPDVVVPIHAVPLTPEGHVDEEALRRVPLLDAELAARWQEHLQRQWGAPEVVARVMPLASPARLLHVSALLERPRASPRGEGQARATGPRRPDAGRAPGAAAMAFADGGALTVPQDAPRTLTEALLHTARTAGDKGLTYVERDGSVQHQTYSELLHEARCVLGGLRANGLRPGARLILQLDSPRDLCAAFWACLLGGFQPVVVAVAATYETRNALVEKLFGVWEVLG